MNKKLLLSILIVSSLLLSGCFSFDGGTQSPTTPTSTELSKIYNNGEFRLQYPPSWDVIEPKDFTTEIPGETQVVIRNNIKNENFTALINVVRNNLQTDKSTLDYAKEVLNRQKTGLLDYKETKREITKVSIAGSQQETYYTEFDGRLNPVDPVIRFIQVYAVKDRKAYIIMGSFSAQEQTPVIDLLQKMVKSFTVN